MSSRTRTQCSWGCGTCWRVTACKAHVPQWQTTRSHLSCLLSVIMICEQTIITPRKQLFIFFCVWKHDDTTWNVCNVSVHFPNGTFKGLSCGFGTSVVAKMNSEDVKQLVTIKNVKYLRQQQCTSPKKLILIKQNDIQLVTVHILTSSVSCLHTVPLTSGSFEIHKKTTFAAQFEWMLPFVVNRGLEKVGNIYFLGGGGAAHELGSKYKSAKFVYKADEI